MSRRKLAAGVVALVIAAVIGMLIIREPELAPVPAIPPPVAQINGLLPAVRVDQAVVESVPVSPQVAEVVETAPIPDSRYTAGPLESSGDQIPVPLATHSFFIGFVDAENRNPGTGLEQLRKDTGMDERAANALLVRAREALKQDLAFQLEKLGELCAQNPEKMTIEQLALDLANLDRDVDKNQGRNAQIVAADLGGENQLKLDLWVAEKFRRNLHFSRADYGKLIESGANPGVVHARFCRVITER